MMERVSVIVPSRNEDFLEKTVDSLFEQSTGDIEVIVFIDGATQKPIPKERDYLKIIYHNQSKGIRYCINEGARLATGKYIMKLDAHSLMEKGYDVELPKVCDDNYMVIPRRYTLDTKTWKPIIERPIDYFYISCPWTSHHTFRWQIQPWESLSQRRLNIPIDDVMIFQGSILFLTKDYFLNEMEGLVMYPYDPFSGVEYEMAFKTWLGGGRIIVDKNLWYAHYHRKNESTRGWSLDRKAMEDEQKHQALYWTTNQWEKRIHNFDWLIEKFWPLPNEIKERYGWPDDWRKYYEQGLNNDSVSK